MKKAVILIPLAVVTLFLTACGGGSETTAAAPATQGVILPANVSVVD